jgi:hypothetical protein
MKRTPQKLIFRLIKVFSGQLLLLIFYLILSARLHLYVASVGALQQRDCVTIIKRSFSSSNAPNATSEAIQNEVKIAQSIYNFKVYG